MRAVWLTMTLLLASSSALAWWSADWSSRKTITLNTTGTGVSIQQPLQDVPVLMRLHGGNFPQFLNVRDGGADFRFTAADDNTPLKYHVERFDPVSQIALIWVKMPAVNPQSTTDKLHMYFGNPAAVKGDEPASTFDADTVAVYHFNETAGLPVDSTAYATAVTGGQVLPNPASLLGLGANLPGTEPMVIGDAPQLAIDPARGWTFSTWLRVESLPEEEAFILDRRDASASVALVLNGSSLRASHNGAEVAAFTPVNAGQWHHVALVLEADQMLLYLDGKQVGGTAVSTTPVGGAITIGGSAAGGGLLTASIDELRIASVARSGDRIAFDATVQGEGNDRMITYSADESGEGGAEAGAEAGHGGYFGIIFQTVFGQEEAIVEQVVIIICGLMAGTALLIMFFKGLFLMRARQAGVKFLDAYNTLAAGDDRAFKSLYEGQRRFGRSPLFQVYRQCIDELNKRQTSTVGAAGAGLNSKALVATRAALDAVMIRQGQRLNSQMVLLTIAISGGPFIGLFGTVVGVMVTFAAIAATGDVNITAIAPGMAAALLATVAGLGVAIPSLFGYNYLGSRIKEITADMYVFADELMARITEQYGD